MARQKVRSGDFFFFEVEGGVGVGQVVCVKPCLYIVIYEGVYEKENLNLDSILLAPIILVGRTLDALFYHGRWVIFGNSKPDFSRIPFLCNKFTEEGVVYVEDFWGKEKRVASKAEAELLTNKLTVAPIRFQKAFLAHHGLSTWDSSYDVITIGFAKDRCC